MCGCMLTKDKTKVSNMKYASDAVECAKIAGKFLREVFRSGNITIEYKDLNETVTSADKGSEQLILEYLTERFPDHKIISEESGASGNGSSEFVWYIDPLDGTTNFAHHIPFFNVSIALQKRSEIICGAVYNPLLDEAFYAEKGFGAYLNGMKIEPSKNSNLKHAFIGCCHGRKDDEISKFIELMRKFKPKVKDMRKLGSGALELCYTACGRIDAFIGYGIKPWDFKAGLLIGLESGCKAGGILKDDIEESNLFMSQPVLHNQIREIIKT